MLFNRNLKNLYQKFIQLSNEPFEQSSIFSNIRTDKQRYKTALLKLLEDSRTTKDQNQLRFAIGVLSKDGIDSDYVVVFQNLLTEQWHEEHEDLVGLSYYLRDQRLTEPIETIANNREVYRKFDDENEATLRKCIHALKAINSERANNAIKKLIATGNLNVRTALEQYQ